MQKFSQFYEANGAKIWQAAPIMPNWAKYIHHDIFGRMGTCSWSNFFVLIEPNFSIAAEDALLCKCLYYYKKPTTQFSMNSNLKSAHTFYPTTASQQ